MNKCSMVLPMRFWLLMRCLQWDAMMPPMKLNWNSITDLTKSLIQAKETIDKYECHTLHSKKKSISKHLFLVLWLVTNRGLYLIPGRTKWYLEAPWQAYWGPDGIWKDNDRHIRVQMDPKLPIMVLPDTIWSFQILNRVLHLWQAEAPKIGAWKYFFS